MGLSVTVYMYVCVYVYVCVCEQIFCRTDLYACACACVYE